MTIVLKELFCVENRQHAGWEPCLGGYCSNPGPNGDCGRHYEKWSNSRYNLKVEPTRFADGWDMQYKRKGRMKGLGLSNREDRSYQVRWRSL